MREPQAGFLELDHTADWEIEVWGPDLPSLFEQAARGMNALKGSQLEPQPRLRRELNLQAPDQESLLVTFLGELLFLEEVEGLGFDTFDILLDGMVLSARLEGAPVRSRGKDIKAVTYHNLAIRKTGEGFEVNIVFDV